MNILVVGSGGREHALVHAIHRSNRVKKIFSAPGNVGMQNIAECIPISIDDIHGIKDFSLKNNIEWVVIGPELPLTLGLTDELNKVGIKTFGVNRDSAKLEGSKAFSKKILTKYNILTAHYKDFQDYQQAKEYVENIKHPVVVKVDGLAAGKGVYICQNPQESLSALEEIFINKKFGKSGDLVVIEEYLIGKEISAFAFSDGKNVLPLIYAQDFKKIYEGDQGANTGGMGSYTPVSFMKDDLKDKVYHQVLKPTIDALKSEGIMYKGILYAGLMIDGENIKVLEYNVRFGDPETQVILPLLKTDITHIFEAIYFENLNELKLEWYNKSAICVVIASKGYPADFKTGFPISGLDSKDLSKDITIYHAGTKQDGTKIINSGGRVLNIVAVKDTLKEAYTEVYKAIELVNFENMYYRRDIAKKELNLN